MSYTHLTISERSKIETYVELGYSIRAITKRIHRSPSTISRELRRHPKLYGGGSPNTLSGK